MTQHHHLAKRIARTGAWRRGLLRTVLLGGALFAVLAGARTERGVAAVLWVGAFLEFFAGVFTLVGLSAVMVAGLVASGRSTPIRLRILAQTAHRTTAVMSMSFLVAHITLKLMERHAPVSAAVVPFLGGQSRVWWIGLGTIASDLMIVLFATGVARGRFIGGGRAWTWRLLHIAAYLCWPIAIVHGLRAGRPAADWVTLSYVACAALVAVGALARLIGSARRRGRTRRRGAPPPPRPDRAAHGRDVPDVPDERFWRELKREAAQGPGGRS